MRASIGRPAAVEREAVRLGGQRAVARGPKEVAVLVADPPQPGPVAEEHPGRGPRVRAQQVRAGGVVAAEVEEAQGPALDRVAVRRRLQVAHGQVPPRDVDGRVDQDVVVEVARHEIDPALVDELAALGVDDAVAGQPPAPPVEEGRGHGPDGHESEVEYARVEQDALHVGERPVQRERVLEMGGEHDAVLSRERVDVVQGRVDPYVGIEVRHRLHAPRQHGAQQEGLDGRGQLDDGVRGGHPRVLRVVEAGRLGPDRRHPRVQPVGEPALGVDHQGCERPPRMVLQEALREDRGLPEVVTGDDRTGVHDGGRLAAPSRAGLRDERPRMPVPTVFPGGCARARSSTRRPCQRCPRPCRPGRRRTRSSGRASGRPCRGRRSPG